MSPQSKRSRKRARQAKRGGPRPPAERRTPTALAEPRPQDEPERRVAAPKSRVDRMLERADARPKPPWHPVPLVELSVLVGLILLVIGFLNASTSHGRLAIGVGLALASLAGLDTAAREHFSGFRSHSSLLAGLPGVATLAILVILRLQLWIAVLGGALVFGAVFWTVRRAFVRRAGVGFKV